MADSTDDLSRILWRIDGRGYKAYKDIRGTYKNGPILVFIDHVQGDPFAAPSKLRLRVPLHNAAWSLDLQSNPERRVALEDYIARKVKKAITRIARPGHGSGKSGVIIIDSGGQEILQRTASVVTEDWVEARIYVGLPASGRRVLGREAERLLCGDLIDIAHEGLCQADTEAEAVRQFVDCAENYEHIRSKLTELGLVAFVADGAVLPRGSGVTDRPMERDKAVPFQSPESFSVTLDLPNPVKGAGSSKQISGMGIPAGVTLIVGGGYHGKSTLLDAMERGVYPHVPGDGREYVVTDPAAVKIRAEDGRRVEKADISPFISNLPFGRDTAAFSSDDASGSTSQAANIMEAFEVGASVLLLDEDTCATNFMVRDARMQELVHKEHEPITPFLERVRELYENHGVSTIMVMGGCGDYFDVADHVILMREYEPYDVTEEARRVAEGRPTSRRHETGEPLNGVRARIPQRQSFDPSRGKKDVKIDIKGRDTIVYGRDALDLRAVEQLVDPSQTRAVGHGIHLATQRFMDGRTPLREVVEAVETFFDEEGLDPLDPFHRKGTHPGDYARPRTFEIAAAINRLRSVKMKQK